MNGGTDPALRDFDAACAATMELLRAIGRSRGRRRTGALRALIAGATVKLPRGVMLPEALLIIDLLAVRPVAGRGEVEGVEIVVGEVKTDPDRGGFTDRRQLAQARAQLGLYLHALRSVTADLPDDERPLFADEDFLVLSRPGSDFPRVRAGEQLTNQAGWATRGFDLLKESAARLPVSPDLQRGQLG